jgi:hypothetical protein
VKKLLVTTAVLMCLTVTVFGRPQLFSQSIEWIEPWEIICEETSDHICVVTEAPFARTFTSSTSDEVKYMVRAGTELKTLNFIKEDKERIDVKEIASHVSLKDPRKTSPDHIALL